MNGQPTLLTRGAMPWRALLCLALVAMLFKAAIPLGYMPDAQAARDGKLVLSFCLPSGMLDSIQVPLDDSPQAAASLECPFALGALPFVPWSASTALAMPAQVAQAPGHAIARALPPLPAAGPPLGSRAPPPHLV